MIPFNKIYLTGNEIENINNAIQKNHIGGGGYYGKKCEEFFENKYGFKKGLVTTSCSNALDIISLLIDIRPGDEVIMPSYTYVSTANSFLLRGANPVFADSSPNSPNIDESKIEALITEKTKAIVIVHYAGISCDMDKIMEITAKHNLILIEDAAHSIDSFFKNIPLGSFGDLSTFSFHETKNVTCGEGGILIVNNEKYFKRAEIIREKGTNRAEYLRGEINKYEWIDLGSSYIPSEILMAFLFAQLQEIDIIQNKRVKIWEQYFDLLADLQNKDIARLPYVPDYSGNNGHIFYLVCKNKKERDDLITNLKSHKISSAFHYLSLHRSLYFKDKYQGEELIYSDIYSDCLIRLPLYCELNTDQVKYISQKIKDYWNC